MLPILSRPERREVQHPTALPPDVRKGYAFPGVFFSGFHLFEAQPRINEEHLVWACR